MNEMSFRTKLRNLWHRFVTWLRFKITGKRIYLGCDYGRDGRVHWVKSVHDHRTGITTVVDWGEF